MRRLLLPLLGGAAGALLTTCCPSAWLTVERLHPEPPHFAGLPDAERRELPVPYGIPNRFDRLRVRPSEAASGYDDRANPAEEAVDETSRFAAALDAIFATRGVAGWAGVALGAATYTAEVKCETQNPDPRGADLCADLLLDELPSPCPVAVLIGARVAAVTSCAEEPAQDVMDGAPPHARARLIISRALPLEDGAQVRVEAAAQVRLSRPLLSFVHLSDIQLRDSNIKIGDRELSAQLDQLIPSVEYDPDQELYNEYVLNAFVATINEAATSQPSPSLRPRFVIHTGDLIDSGTQKELARAHTIMDRLRIPWFSAIGNHDVLVFGNMLPVADGEGDGGCVETSSIVRPYDERVAESRLIPERLCVRQQIHGDAGDRFVATPDHGASRAAFVGGLGHPSYLAVAAFGRVTPRAGEDAACKKLLSIDRATSNYHGFDLRAGADPRTAETIKATMPGYYAFAADPGEAQGGGQGEAADRRMIFIVLNTEQLAPHEGGNTGRLQQDQMSFLSRALGCVGPRDLVFLFGHHALDEVRVPAGGTLRDARELQNASGNIIAYFYGHAHKHGLCRRKRSCRKFWEIEAGSLLEFPQEGRMIRVKEVAGLGFLEMSTFTEQLSASTDAAFQHYVNRARRGAERDYCRQPGTRCAADGVPRREDGDYTHARLFFELPGSPAPQ